MSDTLIELRSVTKSFRGTAILDTVSLSIKRGDSIGIAGRNGAGKSILLRIICGFSTPEAGEVVFDPQLMSAGRTFPDYFGVMIDGPPFVPGLSAIDNLQDLAAIRRRATKAELEQTLLDVGLDPRSPKKARTFSSGMKQKLGIAQALIESPLVLVLDEPFNALDEASVKAIKGILRSRLSAGVTLVFTSHDQSDFEDLDASVFVVDGGQVRKRRAAPPGDSREG